MNLFLKQLPYFFIVTRLLCTPLNLYLVSLGENYSWIIGVLLIYCCLNDIFDGVIARFLGTDTVFMRRFDSVADILYVFSLYYAFYSFSPVHFASIQGLLFTALFVEASVYLLTILRFGKGQSAHNYLSKFFGFYSAIVFTFYFLGGIFNEFTRFSFVLAIIARIDTFLIYCILKKWANDIPSFYHAILYNKGISFKRSKWFHSKSGADLDHASEK
ncbi:MAG: CDP-alcohol phosphatidyltransferase family protein [Bacteriovoracaceae bacterium]|nr:CDP-alcohol phosphatidyltransferase family protein [Bacteriovoracaceae bacterium]